MTTFYTNSKGESVEIATLPYPHLVNAHKKAVASEERKHHTAFINGTTYENKEREAEIDAMDAEIKRRDDAFSKTNEGRDNLVACYRSGQISESAWQEHLEADPGLEAYAGERTEAQT